MGRYNARISKAVRKSEQAIKTFITTEQQLQAQVAEIDSAVSEIDDEIQQLRELRDSAIARRRENVGIIGRLREFINGGE